MIHNKNIPIVVDSYGNRYEFPLYPKYITAVVIAIDRGGGFEPVHICRPDQVYVFKIQEILNTYSDLIAISVLPCDPTSKINIYKEKDIPSAFVGRGAGAQPLFKDVNIDLDMSSMMEKRTIILED